MKSWPFRLLSLWLPALVLAAQDTPRPASPRPHILWLTCEDTGPQLGCYGDAYATTPHLDQLAARGVRYLNAWSSAPVCAPARTAIISGLYPTATGSEHMRSLTRLPAGLRFYPQYLRAAGYYCVNNSKEDYNLEQPGRVWDESSPRAHWKKRRPDQPFFAIFNHTITHESQIRLRPHTPVHDPALVRVPAYHPDTPEVRRDWAQYYDRITEMDAQAGEHLRELAAAGLAEDTIVFFYGDHGPGLPRCKRWPYNSGLHVPLIVYVPSKFRALAPPDYQPGGVSSRLVDFVDLAPTLLSLAGLQPPAHFQGRAFLGPYQTPPPRYLYGFRGRMDERYDLVRSLRDERYVYLRHFLPQKIYGQHISYMFETPTTRVWKERFDAGQLSAVQARFWQTKPVEELYDLRADPDEVHNLAASPEHQEVLRRMRQALHERILDLRDVGFLPEPEIHERARGSTPYEVGHDDTRYPLHRILAAAETASNVNVPAPVALSQALEDTDSAVRYWGALGLLARGAPAVKANLGVLRRALADPAPAVRIVAAEALGQYGPPADLPRALEILIGLAAPDRHGVYTALLALNALDELGPKAAPLASALQKLPRQDPNAPQRMNGYVDRLVTTLLAKWSPKPRPQFCH